MMRARNTTLRFSPVVPVCGHVLFGAYPYLLSPLLCGVIGRWPRSDPHPRGGSVLPRGEPPNLTIREMQSLADLEFTSGCGPGLLRRRCFDRDYLRRSSTRAVWPRSL